MFVVAPDEKISKTDLQNPPTKLPPQGLVIPSIVRHLRVSILAIGAETSQSVVRIMERVILKY